MDEYYETWPKAGIMLDGACYRQPKWEHRISVIDSGLWLTPRAIYGEHPGMIDQSHLTGQVQWATPSAADSKGTTGGGQGRSLKTDTRWPTPRAGNPGSRPNGKGGKVLAEEVKNWPTPNTMDSLPAKSPEALKKEAEEARAGRSEPGNLRDCVSNKHNWPTPMGGVGDKSHGQISGNFRDGMEKAGVKGQLNPDWVEWLMGWPIHWTSLEPITELEWIDWQFDPADNPTDRGTIPRVATGVEARVSRLKAIGNGQVPACVAMAWHLLTEGLR